METVIDANEDYQRVDPKVQWAERKIQIINLCQYLWPTALKYDCHDGHISGGYNDIIFVTITLSPEVDTDFVIRLPREEWYWTPAMDTVAVLHHIRQTTRIRVPDIIAYDTSKDNALKTPYIVLERLPGEALVNRIDHFSTSQLKILARELGQLFAIKSPYSGRIMAASSCHLPSLRPEETLSHVPIHIEPYGARVPPQLVHKFPTSGEIEDIPETFLTSGGLTADPPNLSLEEMTSRALNRRIIQCVRDGVRDEYSIGQRRDLREMMETLVSSGYVDNDSDDFCLWHSDLFPRNIMVDTTRSPMITGIIDWDEAVYAPAFVAAVAPTWLWEPPSEEDEEGEGEMAFVKTGFDEETFEKVSAEPPTEELREVRRVFEEAVGEACAEAGKSHYALLARRILRFALEWQWPYWYHDLFDETCKEFNVLGSVDDGGGEWEDGAVEVEDDDGDSEWETCSDEDSDEESGEE